MPGFDTLSHSLSNPRHDISVSSTATDSLDAYFSELAVAEADVVRMTALLQEMQQRVQTIKVQINSRQCNMIRLLPVEIIQDIFQYTLPNSDVLAMSAKKNSSKEDLMGPLRLCGVSIMWRQIAQSLPSLWTTFYISFSDEAHRVGRQLELLEEWIGRAGGDEVPISFYASSSERVAWAAGTTEKIMKTLGKYSTRWKDVGLRLPSPVYLHLPPPDTLLPCLRSIAIDPPGGQGDRSNAISLLNTPSLRSISLSCVYLRSMSFGWATTTHLSFTSFYTDECLEAVRQAPLVEEIIFRNVLDGDDRHGVPSEPIVLANLKHLRVENEKDTECNLFFDKIQAPSLTSFSYVGKPEVEFQPEGALIGFLTRSGCSDVEGVGSLRSFAIEKIKMEEEGLVSLLRAIGSATSLTLDFTPKTPPEAEANGLNEPNPTSSLGPLTDGVLRQWTVPSDGSDSRKHGLLLPMLETLRYRGPRSFAWETLKAMASSRGPSRSSVIPTLSSVHVNIVDDKGEETVDDMAL